MHKSRSYLLLGTGREKKDTFIQNICKEYPDAEHYNYHSFDTSPLDLVSTLEGQSLFASSILVRYSFVEQLQKAGIDIIKNYLKSPADGTVLFLISEQNKVQPALMSAFPADAKKVFWPPFDNELPTLVRQICAKNHRNITPDAVEILLERIGNDVQFLDEQLRCLFAACKATTITGQEVDRYIYHSKQENVFTFFESLFKHNLAHSLSILETIFSLQQQSNFLGGLRWQFYQVLQLVIALGSNRSLQDIFRELNIQSKRSKVLYHQASRYYSRAVLESLLARITHCEVELRSMDAHLQQPFLELLSYQLIAHQQRSGR